MTIWCKHVYILELQFFFFNCAFTSYARYRDEILDFLFWTAMSKIKNTWISSLYLAQLANTQHKNYKKKLVQL